MERSISAEELVDEERHARVELIMMRKILALEPVCFLSSSKVEMMDFSWRKPYSMTNKGLKLNTPLLGPEVSLDDHATTADRYLIPLDCSIDEDAEDSENSGKPKQLAIVVRSETGEAVESQ